MSSSGVAGFTFDVLGPLRVRDAAGREVAVAGTNRRGVLVALLLARGAGVTVDRVVDLLWSPGGRPLPRDPRNVVQQTIRALRQLLGDRAKTLVRSAPHGYALDVPDESVDLHRFRDLVSRAGGASSRDLAADLLRSALGCWRGEPFADVDLPALDGDRARLAEQRLTATEALLAGELDAGRPAPALVDELRALSLANPLREPTHLLLVRCLAAAGAHAEALAACQVYLRDLAAEMGTGPGAEFAALHARLLDGTHPGRAPAPPPDVPRQLPADIPVLSARDEQLRALDAVLGERPDPVVVISGPGGIGKTALALHWAHRSAARFPDGQLHVDLGGFGPGEPVTADAAVRGFLTALGVDPAHAGTDPRDRAALLRSALADRAVLVVLDNAHDAAQVVDLLPGGGRCATVITSRRRLTGLVSTRWAHHVDLAPLDRAGSLALLTARLGAAVGADPGTADLVEACRGFPLALAVAAGRLRTRSHLGVADLVGHIRRAGLDALSDADPAASVPAVLSWSTRHLDPEQRRLYRLLGACPGPDTGVDNAAALVGVDADQVARLLDDLEAVSLVHAPVPGRYRMHDLVRAHAEAQARAHPEEVGAAQRRVIAHLGRAATAHDRALDPGRHPPGVGGDEGSRNRALAWFDAEHACLLAAQGTAAGLGDHRGAWDLAWALHTYHHRRGHDTDHVTSLALGCAAAERLGDPTAHALAHRLLGAAHARRGDRRVALTHLRTALREAAGDDLGTAQAHHTLAWALGEFDDHLGAVEHAAQALGGYRALGLGRAEIQVLNAIGLYHSRLDHHDTAARLCGEALSRARRARDRDLEAAALDSLGEIALRGGDPDATRHLERAAALLDSLGSTYARTHTLIRLGEAHSGAGRADRAAAAWSEAERLCREQGRHDVVRDLRVRVERALSTSGGRPAPEP
ncbi:BTAD domain-containing putative transcriptional regulator [Actinokineospora bangkokensis]|uniref:Bacterial transcriptional activator domain-containing protein n=1 Tax=Actinokineospora bangkokensis TaxID=1193682 RepID=A0A1Q9LJM6_9PSEU|nr:BTAD domain-containing putative transcriptional regulator [Actinokineospora bangkokensis]OLR92257.1 hypothetical protein BJP25_23370 [Actinokineospora bangkokensis]